MATLPWSDMLLIGHDRIDAEHRVLIELAGEIEDLIEAGASTELVEHHYRRFHETLVDHCVYEERLMDKLPPATYGRKVEAHKCGHALLIAESWELLAGIHDNPQLTTAFGRTIVALMTDLIRDDSNLIGALLHESYHELCSQPAELPANPCL